MAEGDGSPQRIPFFHVDVLPRLVFQLFDHRKVLDGKRLIALDNI